jgi:hypothetical protein
MTRLLRRHGLFRRVATVYGQGNARPIVGGGTGEEDRGASELVRLPPAAVWNAGFDGVVPLWGRGGREVGMNPPWQNGIHLNVVLGPEDGETLGELHDPTLTGRMRRGHIAAEDRGHRAKQIHRPLLASLSYNCLLEQRLMTQRSCARRPSRPCRPHRSLTVWTSTSAAAIAGALSKCCARLITPPVWRGCCALYLRCRRVA